MSNSDARWPRVFTTHGTALFVDPSSGELRHGPLDTSPANARLVAEGTRSQIMYDEGGFLRPIVCLPDRSQSIESIENIPGTSEPTVFQLIRFDQRWVGLRSEGLFLSAEPGGCLTLSRPVCRAWESLMVSEPLLFSRPPRGESAKRTPSLGISCIETRDVTMAVRAVERTAQCVRAQCLYWFSNGAYPKPLRGVEIVNILIPDFTDFAEDINRICLDLMPRVIATDFNLMVQPDGFAVNPQSWDDRFWEYDYIGAAWPAMFGPGPIVGNGGFSLRSRKLYNALLDLRVRWQVQDWLDDERLGIEPYYAIAPNGEKFIPEDIVISLWYRSTLESCYGIRFCPPELANKFSVETVHDYTQYWLGRSFGFHGVRAAPYYGVIL